MKWPKAWAWFVKGLGIYQQHSLGFRISKSQQTSNWEKDQLTFKQQRYAATDAWVCQQIYEKLTTVGIYRKRLLKW